MEKAPFTSLNELSASRRSELKLVSTNDSLEPLVGVDACRGLSAARNCAVVSPSSPAGPDMAIRLVRAISACAPLCPEWIVADGFITTGSPALFKAVLKAIGRHDLPVVINSRGGDLDSALDIGRMIREAGLVTAVSSTRLLSCEGRAAAAILPTASRRPLRGILQDRPLRTRVPLCARRRRQALCRLHGEGTFTRRGRPGRLKHPSGRRLSQGHVDRSQGAEPCAARAPDGFATLALDLDVLGFATLTAEPGFMADAALCRGASPLPNCFRRTSRLAAPAPPAAAGLPPPAAGEMIVVRMRAKGSCGTLCPEWIMAEGAITELTVQRFRAILDEVKDVNLPVVLNSVGGDLDAALAIGRMIRARGLDTIVATTEPLGCAPRDQSCNRAKRLSLPYTGFTYTPGTCARECLFILAAGVRRSGLWQNILVRSLPRSLDHPQQGQKCPRYRRSLRLPRPRWTIIFGEGPPCRQGDRPGMNRVDSRR